MTKGRFCRKIWTVLLDLPFYVFLDFFILTLMPKMICLCMTSASFFRPQRFRRARNGFSLIEAAIVLGIVGLVIGGIWAAAAVVQKNHQVSSLQADVLKMVTSVQRAFKGFTPNDISTRSVGSLDTKIMHTLYQAGVFTETNLFQVCTTSATVNAQNYCGAVTGSTALYLSARKSATDVGDYVMQLGPGSADICIRLVMSFGIVDFVDAGLLAVGTAFREFTDSSQINLSQVKADCSMVPLVMIRFGP